MRTIEEVLGDPEIGLLIHPEWANDYPWLTQGTTGAGSGHDLRLFGNEACDTVLRRWEALAAVTGFASVTHARQVHGKRVAQYDRLAPGLLIAGEADGHATGEPGVLLTVSVADCVPVSIVDPGRRAIAIVHAGWRGVVAGVLGEALRVLAETVGTGPSEVFIHAGPSICGGCYEVGPDVHGQLGLPIPKEPTPVDLAGALGRQAERLGVPRGSLTRSAHCTRCASDRFYSHRAGASGRQVGILGVAVS